MNCSSVFDHFVGLALNVLRKKIIIIQISENKILIAILSNFTVKHLTLRYVCFFLKAIKTAFMLCCDLFLLPIFNCCLLCVDYIVIHFDVFQIFLGLKLSIQENLSIFQDLSKCKYGNFYRGFRPCIPHPNYLLILLLKKRQAQTKPQIHLWCYKILAKQQKFICEE